MEKLILSVMLYMIIAVSSADGCCRKKATSETEKQVKTNSIVSIYEVAEIHENFESGAFIDPNIAFVNFTKAAVNLLLNVSQASSGNGWTWKIIIKTSDTTK